MQEMLDKYGICFQRFNYKYKMKFTLSKSISVECWNLNCAIFILYARSLILESVGSRSYFTTAHLHENVLCKLILDFCRRDLLKFIFSKKATKIDEIFTVDLTLCTVCQSDGEDLVNFCGLFRKHELYQHLNLTWIRVKRPWGTFCYR